MISKISAAPGDPQEVPPDRPARPAEPQREIPPTPSPSEVPGVKEPPSSPRPQEIPDHGPDEMPVRGPSGPRTPYPATDAPAADLPGSEPDVVPGAPTSPPAR